MEFSHALQEKFKDLGSRFWTSHLSVSGAFSFMISIWRQFFGDRFEWGSSMHRHSLQFQGKEKEHLASELTSSSSGSIKSLSASPHSLRKCELWKALEPYGGKYLHVRHQRQSHQLEGQLVSTTKTPGATGALCSWSTKMIFNPKTWKAFNQLVPSCEPFLLKAPGYQQTSPLKLVPGPCETRRPNDWRSFPAPLAALWLHEALPSFQDSSLCRERVPLGRALLATRFFCWQMSKDEGGVPKKHPFESEKIVYTEILRWTILYCSTSVVV